jgi:hypothetical protein
MHSHVPCCSGSHGTLLIASYTSAIAGVNVEHILEAGSMLRCHTIANGHILNTGRVGGRRSLVAVRRIGMITI